MINYKESLISEFVTSNELIQLFYHWSSLGRLKHVPDLCVSSIGYLLQPGTHPSRLLFSWTDWYFSLGFTFSKLRWNDFVKYRAVTLCFIIFIWTRLLIFFSIYATWRSHIIFDPKRKFARDALLFSMTLNTQSVYQTIYYWVALHFSQNL